MSEADFLSPILERKRVEVDRRRRHVAAPQRSERVITRAPEAQRRAAIEALRRPPGAAPRIIAEIKWRSPSAGALRRRRRGDVAALARAYVGAGASAISVLADRPGFGGSPLDVRRASLAVAAPVLFKEFVLDEVQVSLARDMGASLVLLLVRALSAARLAELIAAARSLGLLPVVEAADAAELEVALATGAEVVGVNARDLRSFEVDTAAAQALLASVPRGPIAVHMSGVRSQRDFARVAGGRADAVLIGEALMRAAEPAVFLRGLVSGAR